MTPEEAALFAAIVLVIVWGARAKTRYRRPKSPGEVHDWNQAQRQKAYDKARKSGKTS